MKAKILAMILLGSSTLFAGNFSIGVNIGTPRGGVYVVQPPPPPPLVRVVPRSPGRNYVWVPGGWVWNGYRYNWQNGYWVRQYRGNGYRYGYGR